MTAATDLPVTATTVFFNVTGTVTLKNNPCIQFNDRHAEVSVTDHFNVKRGSPLTPPD